MLVKVNDRVIIDTLGLFIFLDQLFTTFFSTSTFIFGL